MCRAGRKAKSPARCTTGFSPFISTRSTPLTIINCSLGVCQCQGAVQPAANLVSITEGPVAGSPRSTATVMQAGAFGTGVNLLVAAFLITACSDDSCATMAGEQISKNTLAQNKQKLSLE